MTNSEALTDTEALWRLVELAAWKAEQVPRDAIVRAFLDLNEGLQKQLLHLSLVDDGPLHGLLVHSVSLHASAVQAFWDQGPGGHLAPRSTDSYPDWIWVTIARSPELRARAEGARAKYEDEALCWTFPDAYSVGDPAAVTAELLQALAWWPYLVRQHEQVALALQRFVEGLYSASAS